MAGSLRRWSGIARALPIIDRPQFLVARTGCTAAHPARAHRRQAAPAFRRIHRHRRSIKAWPSRPVAPRSCPSPPEARMDFRHLECFFVLAQELHFGRAAERLHVGQSSVSESIRALEKTVGAPLFDRTSRRVALTPLGQALREGAEAAYMSLKTTLADCRRTAHGGRRGAQAALRLPGRRPLRAASPAGRRIR
ncbi:LysR family transcriptional regulator [Burkholderia gladioli]|uniref:LysR family transcriptional regulator n=1 Tax=Burkholderia gladioli TaxID=28095 RepID=UPI001FC803D2|nr:LysR family transcriptional regulator [Burkholderia gladioli]